MQQDAVHLHQLGPGGEPGLEVCGGLDATDRQQGDLSAAQASQLLDLRAGLGLLCGVLPGAIALAGRWRAGIMGSEQAVITQLQQQFGQLQRHLAGQAAQFDRQRHATLGPVQALVVCDHKLVSAALRDRPDLIERLGGLSTDDARLLEEFPAVPYH